MNLALRQVPVSKALALFESGYRSCMPLLASQAPWSEWIISEHLVRGLLSSFKNSSGRQAGRQSNRDRTEATGFPSSYSVVKKKTAFMSSNNSSLCIAAVH